MNDIREIIILIERANAQAVAGHIRDVIGVDTLNQLDAWNLTAPNSGLKFRTRNSGDINYVEITHKENNLYDIVLGTLSGVMDTLRDRHKVIDTINDVPENKLRNALNNRIKQ